jgi:hypothetical protein
MATLGPDVARFRSMARRSMRDRCRITRPTADQAGTLDEITGVWTPAAAPAVYDGPCRARPASLTETETMFGGEPSTLQRFVVVIPYDAAEVRRGDRVAIVESGDGQLGDRRLGVIAVSARSDPVDRRLACEEVVQ